MFDEETVRDTLTPVNRKNKPSVKIVGIAVTKLAASVPACYHAAMTGHELRDALDRLGLSQSHFARMLTEHSVAGVTISRTTVNRWCQDTHPIPGAVALAICLLARIREIDDQFTARRTK